jgi:hypothetical protein
MKKAKRTSLIPRTNVGTAGFSMPHHDLYADAMRLFDLMRQAVETVNAGMNGREWKREGLHAMIPHAAWDVSMFARAVELFSALAVESAINTYGLVRYGELEFEGKLGGNVPLIDKLRGVLEPVLGRPIDDGDELVVLVRHVAAKRRELVHRRSDESRIDAEGKMSSVTPVQEGGTPETAAESLAIMRRFFEIFPLRDPIYGHFMTGPF